MVENEVIQRLRLEVRLSRHYAIKRQILQIASQSLKIVSVADPNRLPEPKAMSVTPNPTDDRGTPDWPPYWAQIWESSLVLSHALAEYELQDKRVLDLGCGLGLVGTMAASLGAKVMMCDIASPALLFARLNAWPWREKVRTRRIDWRNDRLSPSSFHLILGADILYDSDEWPYLNAFWREHVLPDGEILLGEPNRIGSELFPVWIAKCGWNLTTSQVATTQTNRPFRLLRLRQTHS
jgi:predicted nicotinamide N-methyase